jgi:cytochrome c oxidase subunit 2
MKAEVNGFQWWWEIRYNEGKVLTASEMHIPAGQVVNVELGSQNVIHSFWVPRIMGKTDTMPGHVNATWLYSDQLGTYDGQCAEFCGAQHANMLFRVIVQTPEEFQAWLASQEAPPVEPAPGSIEAQGKEILLNPDKKCVGCHAIQGTAAQGVTGPNLTHFATRGCFAGCMFQNNTENLTRWLQNPQAMKPGNLMVIPTLTPEEIGALTAYLESLR